MKGAFWGLILGLVIGMVRFVWQFSYKDSPCGIFNSLDSRPELLSKVHYLHFAIILFLNWQVSVRITLGRVLKQNFISPHNLEDF